VVCHKRSQCIAAQVRLIYNSECPIQDVCNNECNIDVCHVSQQFYASCKEQTRACLKKSAKANMQSSPCTLVCNSCTESCSSPRLSCHHAKYLLHSCMSFQTCYLTLYSTFHCSTLRKLLCRLHLEAFRSPSHLTPTRCRLGSHNQKSFKGLEGSFSDLLQTIIAVNHLMTSLAITKQTR
jgi:hypothetical protein